MTKLEKYCKFIINFSFIFILLIGIIKNIGGDDFLWHVKVGEWIIENKEIPKTGIFSWFAENENWFAHEWLSGVLMYFCSFISTTKAAHIFLTICIISLSSIIAYINRERFYKNPLLVIIWELLGFLIVSTYSTARPHWITLSLLVIYICILEKVKENNFKYIWFIPLLAIFWSNVHGGSSNLLYLLPFGFLITGIKNWKFGRLISNKMTKKQIITYIGIIINNLICICINPRGIELLWYPYSYADMNTNYITEWLPLSYGNLKLAFIVIMVILILLVVNKKEELELSEIGLIGLFIIMSFLHLRFCLWTYAIASIYIFKYFDELKIKNEYTKDNITVFCSIFYTITTIAILISPFFVKDIKINQSVPTELIQIIKEDNPKRLYNDYNYGGCLIYNNIDTFIDGRADMYEWIGSFEENMKLFTFSLDYQENVKDYIEKYNFDSILTAKKSYIHLALKNIDNYELIYEDDNICYYKIIK